MIRILDSEMLVLAALRAASAIRNDLDIVLAKYDVTTEQWALMRALWPQPRRQGELARLVGKDASTITRTVDLLARRKLVARRRHEPDGRVMLAGLTPKGDDLMRETHRVMQAACAHLTGNATGAAMASATQLLERLATHVFESRELPY